MYGSMTGRYIKRFVAEWITLPATWAAAAAVAPDARGVVVATDWTKAELRHHLMQRGGTTGDEADSLVRRLKMRRGWLLDDIGKVLDAGLSPIHEPTVIVWLTTDAGAPIYSPTPVGHLTTVGHWRREDGLVLKEVPGKGKLRVDGRGLYAEPVTKDGN